MVTIMVISVIAELDDPECPDRCGVNAHCEGVLDTGLPMCRCQSGFRNVGPDDDPICESNKSYYTNHYC